MYFAIWHASNYPIPRNFPKFVAQRFKFIANSPDASFIFVSFLFLSLLSAFLAIKFPVCLTSYRIRPYYIDTHGGRDVPHLKIPSS